MNPPPLGRYFDKVDFRLHPVHPFLHLLPAAEPQLIEEADRLRMEGAELTEAEGVAWNREQAGSG